MANIPILSFNAGELSPQIDARSDVEKYRSGCRHLENLIPRIYGGAERRPGTYYLTSSYGAAQIVRKIPFIYSSTIAYELEFGNKYIRAFYADAVIVTIASPYLATDLFQLQYKQVGDVMWLVHPSYAQRKLTRTSATTFSLDAISFTKGPFLLRNDLIDPDESDAATLACTVTDVDDSGTLTCTGEVFDDDHVGAIFKLVHPRASTSVSQSGAGTSSALAVKGTFTFDMQRTGSGDVILQRRENSTSANDWENYRTFAGDYSRNVQFSGVEDADNVEYRINSSASSLSASVTINESTQDGIVKITAVASTVSATVTVLTALASTNATKRWAEGAWSDYRGYPSSVTFTGDRCVYGGQADIPTQIVTLDDPLIIHTLTDPSGNYLIKGLTDVGDDTWSVDYSVNQGSDGGSIVTFDGTYIYCIDGSYIEKFDETFVAVNDWPSAGAGGRMLVGASLSKVLLATDKSTGNVVYANGTSIILMDSDGTQIWTTTAGGYGGTWRRANFADNGDVLAGKAGVSATNPTGYRLSKVNGAVLATYNTNSSAGDSIYEIYENPVNSKIIVGGRYGGSLQKVICYLSSGGGDGDEEWSNTITGGEIISVYCSVDGDIFVGSVVATNPAGSVHKYSSAGVYQNSYDTGANVFGIAARDWNSLVVVGARGTNENSETGQVNIIDTSLTYERGYDYGASYNIYSTAQRLNV